MRGGANLAQERQEPPADARRLQLVAQHRGQRHGQRRVAAQQLQ
jgi:hypothetical protein